MNNPWNLPAATIRKIETLDGPRLDAAARQLLSGNIDHMSADERRAAIAEYCADGGTVRDLA